MQEIPFLTGARGTKNHFGIFVKKQSVFFFLI